jgi:hypothetical protein
MDVKGFISRALSKLWFKEFILSPFSLVIAGLEPSTLGMTRQVFNHCAVATVLSICDIDFFNFHNMQV